MYLDWDCKPTSLAFNILSFLFTPAESYYLHNSPDVMQVQGSTLKILVQRCKFLRCLLLQQTNLNPDHVQAVEWEKATALQVITAHSSVVLNGTAGAGHHRVRSSHSQHCRRSHASAESAGRSKAIRNTEKCVKEN